MTAESGPGDGILFAGNPHESVPRALFLDTRLTPLERNAWQVIRLMLNDDGITAFPTYEQLRPFLASLPCSTQASDETIARALTVLRLSRWLSLARHRRDRTTGRIQGNVYVLHDQPLTPYEALRLDPEYLELVSTSLVHASKTIQYLAYRVVSDLTGDPLMTGRVLPSRLETLLGQLATSEWTIAGDEASPVKPGPADNAASVPCDCRGPTVQQSGQPVPLICCPSSESEGGMPSSDSEGGGKSLNSASLRNPKEDSTVRTVQDLNYKIRTVPRARTRVRPPEAFGLLRAEQQAGALAALQPLDTAIQQTVLDEWDARCRGHTVRNPAGYLFGLIQRALRGEFHPWASQAAGRSDLQSKQTNPETESDDIASRRTRAEEHIARLKNLLAIRR